MVRSERRKGYDKGYKTGRRTGERKAKKDYPLSADQQKKDMDKALKRLRWP